MKEFATINADLISLYTSTSVEEVERAVAKIFAGKIEDYTNVSKMQTFLGLLGVTSLLRATGNLSPVEQAITNMSARGAIDEMVSAAKAALICPEIKALIEDKKLSEDMTEKTIGDTIAAYYAGEYAKRTNFSLRFNKQGASVVSSDIKIDPSLLKDLPKHNIKGSDGQVYKVHHKRSEFKFNTQETNVAMQMWPDRKWPACAKDGGFLVPNWNRVSKKLVRGAVKMIDCAALNKCITAEVNVRLRKLGQSQPLPAEAVVATPTNTTTTTPIAEAPEAEGKTLVLPVTKVMAKQQDGTYKCFRCNTTGKGKNFLAPYAIGTLKSPEIVVPEECTKWSESTLCGPCRNDLKHKIDTVTGEWQTLQKNKVALDSQIDAHLALAIEADDSIKAIEQELKPLQQVVDAMKDKTPEAIKTQADSLKFNLQEAKAKVSTLNQTVEELEAKRKELELRFNTQGTVSPTPKAAAVVAAPKAVPTVTKPANSVKAIVGPSVKNTINIPVTKLLTAKERKAAARALKGKK
jgi:hypothetical protein